MAITLVIRAKGTLNLNGIYNIISCGILVFLKRRSSLGKAKANFSMSSPSLEIPKDDTASPRAKMMPWKGVVLCWKWWRFWDPLIHDHILLASVCLNSRLFMAFPSVHSWFPREFVRNKFFHWLIYGFREVFPSNNGSIATCDLPLRCCPVDKRRRLDVG